MIHGTVHVLSCKPACGICWQHSPVLAGFWVAGSHRHLVASTLVSVALFISYVLTSFILYFPYWRSQNDIPGNVQTLQNYVGEPCQGKVGRTWNSIHLRQPSVEFDDVVFVEPVNVVRNIQTALGRNEGPHPWVWTAAMVIIIVFSWEGAKPCRFQALVFLSLIFQALRVQKSSLIKHEYA